MIIIFLIRLGSKGTPIFRQERLGYKMKRFKVMKFRTMINNAEAMGTGVFTKENDNRVTKVGSFLRKHSLDELPQLFNIIKGEMSFVGPRPPVTYFPYKIDDYPKKFIRRFDMRPGITGLAQISGRTNLTWEERFVYDISYVNNYTVFSDLRIIYITIIKVFKKENVFPTEKFIKENHKLRN